MNTLCYCSEKLTLKIASITCFVKVNSGKDGQIFPQYFTNRRRTQHIKSRLSTDMVLRLESSVDSCSSLTLALSSVFCDAVSLLAGQIKKSMLGSRSQSVLSVPRSWIDRWPAYWGSTVEGKANTQTHKEDVRS